MNLEGVAVLNKEQQRNVSGGDKAGKRPCGCREWTISFFRYTLVEYNNDECQNSDGNWDWGGNGSIP